MNKFAFMLIASAAIYSFAASAQEINYESMTQAGFGDVGELLKSMTPEQQEAIIKSAALKQKDLEKLSPAELQSLRTELRREGDTIYMNKIDPEKLNVSSSKSTQDELKDLDNYQIKYEQGKIHNSVVKPVDE